MSIIYGQTTASGNSMGAVSGDNLSGTSTGRGTGTGPVVSVQNELKRARIRLQEVSKDLAMNAERYRAAQINKESSFILTELSKRVQYNRDEKGKLQKYIKLLKQLRSKSTYSFPKDALDNMLETGTMPSGALSNKNVDAAVYALEKTLQEYFEKYTKQTEEEQEKQEHQEGCQSEVKAEVTAKRQHPKFDLILRHVSVGNLVFLTGPAGSGKTTIGMQVAEALGKNFYFTGAVHQKHELLGFIDAKGDLVRTPFREAYENGGVFLFDEFDACTPHAVTPFNAALSNKQCAFPDGIVHQHEDFVAIAAGNTFGTGANRQYVGRYQQDAASLDRFVFIEIDYDISLEEELAIKFYVESGGTSRHMYLIKNFLIKVKSVRKALNTLGIPHIVSPRASFMAAKFFGANTTDVTSSILEDSLIWKGLSEDQRRQINAEVNK